MRKTAVFLALMLAAGTALADTYAFGNRVISSGDSIGGTSSAGGDTCRPTCTGLVRNAPGITWSASCVSGSVTTRKSSGSSP